MRHMDEGLLQAWLDGPRGGLTAEERVAVEDHVAECEACAARLESLRAIDAEVSELLASTEVAEHEIPAFAEVVARARALDETAVHREAQGRKDSGSSGGARWWGPVTWAASVAVALGAGWLANEWTRPVAEPVLAPIEVTTAPPAGAGASGEAGPGVEGSVPGAPATVVAEAAADSGSTGTGAGGVDAEPPPVLAEAEPVVDPGDSTVPGRPAERMADAAEADLGLREVAPPDSGLLTPIIVPPDTTVRVAETVPDATGERAVAAAAPELARGRPSIVGRVVDAATRRPLEAAQVFVPGTGMGALTNAEGRFLLVLDPGVDSAEIELRVELVGYRVERRALALNDGRGAVGDVGMQQTAVALDELVVTGTGAERRELPVVVRTPLADGDAWRASSLAGADGETRFPVRTVPELEVTSVHVGIFDGATVVRVVQELEDGRSLEILQSARAMAVDAEDGVAAVSLTLDDGVFVVGRAELSPDSIRALLERIR